MKRRFANSSIATTRRRDNGRPGKEILSLAATPGATVTLSAAGTTDPDGNRLGYEWFVHPEAGTFRGDVCLDQTAGVATTLAIPTGAAGKSIHLVLAVRDDGQPPLTSYRRAVLDVSLAPK